MKDQIKMIVFVIILGVAASAILVGTDSYTKDMIKENAQYSLKSTILTAFEIDYDDNDLIEIYDKTITEKTVENNTFYYLEDGSVGFELDGKGLWGPIRGFITLEEDLITIRGLRIIYNEETPGLGGIIAEAWYLDKFKGKKMDSGIVIKKDADASSLNEVDAITGATRTSKAFEVLLNENYSLRKEVLE